MELIRETPEGKAEVARGRLGPLCLTSARLVG
jgi:hypothetical protein